MCSHGSRNMQPPVAAIMCVRTGRTCSHYRGRQLQPQPVPLVLLNAGTNESAGCEHLSRVQGG